LGLQIRFEAGREVITMAEKENSCGCGCVAEKEKDTKVKKEQKKAGKSK